MSAKCSVSGCTYTPEWYPVFVLKPEAFPDEEDSYHPHQKQLYSQLSSPLCHYHRLKLDIGHFLTDDTWEIMEEYFESQGRDIPPKELLELHYVRMDARTTKIVGPPDTRS